MALISRIGQALNFTRKLGQGIQQARRIGSIVNRELGGALMQNKYGRMINDISRTAGDVTNTVGNVLEKAQTMDNKLRRL